MSYNYVIDSYAWIEYFRASKAGSIARHYLEDEDNATPAIVIAELARKLAREVEAKNETRENANARLEFIRANSEIIDLGFELAKAAGELDVSRKATVKGWSLADSIILASARAESAKVVTGDDHFTDLEKEVIMIK